MKSILLVALIAINNLCWAGTPSNLALKGFNLSESKDVKFDANEKGPNTPAQNAVDYIQSLGAKHITLNIVGSMIGRNGTEIIPPSRDGSERIDEKNRLLRLMSYIKKKGMTVGIRPFFLVTIPAGEKDYFEHKGQKIKIWHGNITPSPSKVEAGISDKLLDKKRKEAVHHWFDSYRDFLNIYATIAKRGGAQMFNIGSELYSMTIGTEDLWPEFPYGFPTQWLTLVRGLKKALGPSIKISYDINYTDATATSDGTGNAGGEFERWRQRLVEYKPQSAQSLDSLSNEEKLNVQAWETLKNLWQEIDVMGLDVYRSLMSKDDKVPSDYRSLVTKLTEIASRHASDIDVKMAQINDALGFKKKVVFKELGFKSCKECFVDSYEYDDASKERSIPHQAAAYQAFFNAYVVPKWSWLEGVTFWDVGIDPDRAGPNDPGFTPRGKAQTEAVIRKYFLGE